MFSRLAVILGVIGLLLTSCAADPRDQADADNSRLLTAERVADQEQARQQAAELHELRLQQQESTAAARSAAAVLIVRAAALGLDLVIAAVAVGLSWGVIGAGRAMARAAELRGNMITLDSRTRTFPLLLQYSGKGFYTLTNCNTGQVIRLDTRQQADRQQITVLGAVLTAGVIASEARRAKDSAAVVLARPEVITLGRSQNG